MLSSLRRFGGESFLRRNLVGGEHSLAVKRRDKRGICRLNVLNVAAGDAEVGGEVYQCLVVAEIYIPAKLGEILLKVFGSMARRSILAHQAEYYVISETIVKQLDSLHRIGELARQQQMSYYHSALHNAVIVKLCGACRAHHFTYCLQRLLGIIVGGGIFKSESGGEVFEIGQPYIDVAGQSFYGVDFFVTAAVIDDRY